MREAHFNLAQLLRERGDREGYLAQLRLGVEQAPDFGACYFFLAREELGAGRLEKAADLASRGLKVDNVSDVAPLGYYVLADVYNRQGRSAKSAEAVEKARRLERPIMMNVSVAGTTELGTVDPVDEVNELLRQYRRDEGIHIWHHVDAAYGGYFCATFRHGESELDERTIGALATLTKPIRSPATRSASNSAGSQKRRTGRWSRLGCRYCPSVNMSQPCARRSDITAST